MPLTESASATSLRILVVDDEPSICTLVRILLQDESREITTAADGVEALQHFVQQPFDLVITDRAMPRLGGEALAHAIKRRSPCTPIILITGLLGAMVDATPFDGFLAKPFTRTQLYEVVAETLNLSARS